MRLVELLGCAVVLLTSSVVQADSEIQDEAGWTNLGPGPGPRYATSMVLDAARDRLLIFSGQDNGQDPEKPAFRFLDDLWSYDLKTRKWAEVRPEGDRPAPRSYAAACYDDKRDVVWLFGGFTPRFVGDMWCFDGASETWREVKPGGDVPGPRDAMDLIYNPETDQIILFGGLTSFNPMQVVNDVWAFDIATETWARIATANEGPAGRFCACTALDVEGQRLFVLGGFNANGGPIESSLWTLDLKTRRWSKNPTNGKAQVSAGRMVYQDGKLWIAASGLLALESWLNPDTGEWTLVETDAPLPARNYHAAAYDPIRDATYVFGGTEGGFGSPCVAGDLWVRGMASESDPPAR